MVRRQRSNLPTLTLQPPVARLLQPWSTSNCSWAGAGIAASLQSSYYWWDTVPAGDTKTYVIAPADPYLYPTGAPPSSAMWIGVDAMNWGEAVLFTITVDVLGWSNSTAETSTPPVSNNEAVVGGAGSFVGISVFAVATYCLARRRRGALACKSQDAQRLTGDKRNASDRLYDAEPDVPPAGAATAAATPAAAEGGAEVWPTTANWRTPWAGSGRLRVPPPQRILASAPTRPSIEL
jgi:hypothetical protein